MLKIKSILTVLILLTVGLVALSTSAANAASYPVSGKTDFYITATAGQTITASTSGTIDAYITIFSPAGVALISDDDGLGYPNSLISNYSFPSNGVYRLNASVCCSADANWSGSYTMNITTAASVSTTYADTTPPTVSSISINANAGADGTYIAGDVITTTIAWSENVTITGSPRIPIQGLTGKYFTYSSGSGTTSTTFTYTVVSGDTDADGVAISANTLELNSGTIKDAANNAATLTHSAVTAATTQKVDTTAPTFSSASTNSAGTQVILTYSEALSATTAATSTFSVSVAGSAATVSTVATSGSTVVVTLSSAIKTAQSVTVAYTDPSAGNDVNAVQDVGGNDAASLSSTSVTNISTVKQSQSTLTLNSGSSAFGVPILLQATGGSGTGSLSYSVSSGPCTIVNGDSLTATGQGTCSVIATKATDSTYLSVSSTAASFVIGVGSSNSTITLAPGSFVFRESKNVSARASVSGKVTFTINDKYIPGCRNLIANAGNSYTATCAYKPSIRGFVIVKASLVPSDANYNPSVSASEKFFIFNRTTTR